MKLRLSLAIEYEVKPEYYSDIPEGSSVEAYAKADQENFSNDPMMAVDAIAHCRGGYSVKVDPVHESNSGEVSDRRRPEQSKTDGV